jgi:hypothetical protein
MSLEEQKMKPKFTYGEAKVFDAVKRYGAEHFGRPWIVIVNVTNEEGLTYGFTVGTCNTRKEAEVLAKKSNASRP